LSLCEYREAGPERVEEELVCSELPQARALLRKTFDDEAVINNALKESRYYIVVDISCKKTADS
jgi:transcription elongation factor GreB